MKLKIWIAIFLLIVNAALAMTIYFMIKPEAKNTLLTNVTAINVPQLPEVELPKVEVTEADVEDVKQTVKTKLYERAQLMPDGNIVGEDEEAAEDYNALFVEEWGLTFHLPEAVKHYNISLRKDVLTVERHLQPMVYIVRYDEGEKSSLKGESQQLASYKGSEYYLRKGSFVGEGLKTDSEHIEEMRSDVYEAVLRSYHFEQE